MVISRLYDSQIDWRQHEAAMQGLAKELGLPMAEINHAYENALKELKSQARITNFLSVFACRRVRELAAHK